LAVLRSSAEYAVLVNIFREIREQEKSWQPRTLFDFGSGVATGYWAASEVFGKLTEVSWQLRQLTLSVSKIWTTTTQAS
jgi:ribosomal protein RSM22 (predicted rRNA methylase)